MVLLTIDSFNTYIYIYFFKSPSHQTVERRPAFGHLLFKQVTVLVMGKH